MTQNFVMRLPEVMKVTGMSRSLIYRYIKNGRFPKQIKLGERASGWLAEEIICWVADRVSARAQR